MTEKWEVDLINVCNGDGREHWAMCHLTTTKHISNYHDVYREFIIELVHEIERLQTENIKLKDAMVDNEPIDWIRRSQV